jgi:hypothetical protein
VSGLGVWEMVRDGQVVADVVRFSDDETVTKWRGKYRSLTRWETFGDATAVHTHFGQDEGRTLFQLRALIPDQEGEQ